MAEKNIFKGVQIVFTGKMFDNSKHNAMWKHPSLQLPETETSIERVERQLQGILEGYGCKWEREFTNVANDQVTMYISSTQTIAGFVRDSLKKLQRDGLLTSITYGSMKTDASFYPSKNQY